MNDKYLRLLGPVVLLASACAPAQPPPLLGPEPPPVVVLAAEPEPEPAPAPPPVRDPEPPVQERWESPFAVSSSGQVATRERRTVSILNGDPSSQAAATGSSGGASTRAAAPAAPPPARPGGSSPSAGTAPAGSSTGRTSVPAAPPPPTAQREPATPSRTSASSAATRQAEEDQRIADALAARRQASSGSGSSSAGSRTPTPDDADREDAPSPNWTRGATHTVARGDTWYGIASRYGVAPRLLAAANPSVDPERIRISQTLRIPSAAGEVTTRVHRVGSGDTLWGIARRYNVTPDEIRAFNDMDDERVQVGQVLRIPPR